MDMIVTNEGSIWILEILTDLARAWFEENVEEPPAWSHLPSLNGAVACDWRMGKAIVEAAIADGLSVGN